MAPQLQPRGEQPNESQGHRLAELRKQRKKEQNKINQREHRRRKAAEESQNTQSKPFRVVRFRLESSGSESEYKAGNKPFPNKAQHTNSSEHDITDVQLSPRDVQHPSSLSVMPKPIRPEKMDFPLSSDHLLRLIYHTVFRALVANKDLLRASATFTMTRFPVTGSQPCRNLCGTYTVMHAGSGYIPKSLTPTVLQMTKPHSAWMDMFPFERLRDNLIKNEDCFDHEEMHKDLFGGLVNDVLPSSRRTHNSRLRSGALDSPKVDEDTLTADRKGLIIWGEPHDKQSWEATPGFIEKYTWALEGVDELIESSNRWRALRGEEPIRVLFP